MIWLHLFWFLVLSIGNAEVLVTLVNRIHSLPVQEYKLRHIRHVHDLLIPLWPSWLIVVPGFTAPGVLLNPVSPAETWSRLPMMVQGWFVVCFLGFGGFCLAVLRYWTYRSPRQQVSIESTVVDFEEQLGGKPVADGPYSSLIDVPFNECFEVEFTEREFEIDRLPAEWAGLTILHLTDLHYTGTIDQPFFDAVFDRVAHSEYDLAVVTGDVLDGEKFAEWLPDTLGRVDARLGRYFILGNHDWGLNTDLVRKSIADLGWVDVSSTVHNLEIEGRSMVIGGDERPWMGTGPDFETSPDGAFRLLLSHTPDNFSWARRQRVDLMLAGHNHGGQVVLPGIGPVYSPSVHGCRYASGVFYREPTLLFVGRGLSGKHPLRIGARPEISRLTLVPKAET